MRHPENGCIEGECEWCLSLVSALISIKKIIEDDDFIKLPPIKRLVDEALNE